MNIALFALFYVACLIAGMAAVCFNLNSVVAWLDRRSAERSRKRLVKLYMRRAGMPRAIAERQSREVLSTGR